MKGAVDLSLCTGCGECEILCPEVFEVVNNVSRVRTAEVLPECEEDFMTAAQECSSGAISIQK